MAKSLQRILITGASGYIGGRLIELLAFNVNYKVTALARSINNELVSRFSRVKFISLDLLDYESDLDEACQNIDCIIHLAAVNEILSKKNPILAVEMNILASVRLLESAKKNNVERFIYISTAHVYGSPLKGVLNENSLCKPCHPYAITHKAVEDFVLAAHKNREIEGVVLRLSNSFGAPILPTVNRWSLLLNNLARSAVEKKRIILRSNGAITRDFITLSDTCAAIKFFVDIDGSNLSDGLYNLGGDMSITLNSVVSILTDRSLAILGFMPDVIRIEPDSSNISCDLDYSIEKIKRTGFVPAKKINDEVDRLLDFCRKEFPLSVNHRILVDNEK